MVSRRTILKSIGILGLSAATSAAGGVKVAARPGREPDRPFRRWNGHPLARVTGLVQRVRAEPTTDAEVTIELPKNTVVRVRRVVRGQMVFSHSDEWLETRHGFIYSTLVQPMYYHLPSVPEPDLGEGRWAELIVPTSEAFRRPDPFNREASVDLVYYGNVFYVTELVTGTDGRAWYKVRELYQTIYIRAAHLRLIPNEDLAPIRPEIAPRDKHLVINLSEETITAYEYDEPVWMNPVSSGINPGDTPEGRHYIFDKRPSDRMVASLASDDPDFYNLPGVPFVCYFTLEGVGTHGTYWHNDYGRERSHGCVNLNNEAARWVWRWSTPHAPLTELYWRPSTLTEGTRIEVIRP
jgi:lipoprotein-anchoring transpeptidase ErfK/SrfK